jgi:hypothetical protein
LHFEESIHAGLKIGYNMVLKNDANRASPLYERFLSNKLLLYKTVCGT